MPVKFRLRVEQVADALRDHAGLACARAGHYDQRAFAMMRGGALLGIELNARRRSGGVFEQVGHEERFPSITVAQALGV